ncbi:MAG TPA: hypothetical protein GX709_04500 [Clostridiales bacterium]|nr:hypothetical protein [Clostridiales bacterium]
MSFLILASEIFGLRKKNVIELAFIQKYIDEIEDEKVKLFFRIAFSIVVRSVSLTRNSEFKLYRIEKSKIPDFNPDAIKEFLEILERNHHLIYEYSKKVNYETKIDIYEMNAKILQIWKNFTMSVIEELEITKCPLTL